MHIEHIDPSGGDQPDNLALACANCNQIKGVATSATDPQTQQAVSLFNPRQQNWHEHFEWKDGISIHGLTPTGRATIERLKMNLDRIVEARRVWVRTGYHPPQAKS